MPYRNIDAFLQSAHEDLYHGRLDRALHSVRGLVEEIITEPLCVAQVFGSHRLDALCQEIGRLNLSSFSDIPAPPPQDIPLYAYLVTKLQKSGGHTRVIEDFIRARPAAKHFILSTETEGTSDRKYLLTGLLAQKNVHIEFSVDKNFHKKLSWLQMRLLQTRPNKTYLFNHHQDSVIISAIQPDMGLEFAYYHHGDHHLCLGVYLQGIEHIDSHSMGYHNCRKNLKIDNVYIPLATEDHGGRPEAWAFKEGGRLTTCTAARSNKVEIPYFASYVDIVPQLISTTGGRHIHIGRLTPWALWKIQRELKKKRIPNHRFVYLPWTKSVWKTLQEKRVDLYVSSFPYGGALTLVEAMGAGVPVALHKHISSRTLSLFDMAYPEAFSWRNPQELLDYCAQLTNHDLKDLGRKSRDWYLRFHQKELLSNAIEDPFRNPPPCSTEEFVPQQDEWALWASRQLSFGRTLRRSVYRLFRRARATLTF